MIRELDKVPECSAISQLQCVNELDAISADHLLFIVSEKYPNTETGYISKSLKYGDAIDAFYQSLSLDVTNENIKILSADVDIWNEFRERFLSTHGQLNTNVQQPWILSNMTMMSGMVVGISGYYLSAGMQTVFGQYKFPQICATYGKFDNIWLNGHSLSYEELVKDQFLNNVQVISDKMVFDFKLADGNPNIISVDLSSFAGSIGLRDWMI